MFPRVFDRGGEKISNTSSSRKLQFRWLNGNMACEQRSRSSWDVAPFCRDKNRDKKRERARGAKVEEQRNRGCGRPLSRCTSFDALITRPGICRWRWNNTPTMNEKANKRISRGEGKEFLNGLCDNATIEIPGWMYLQLELERAVNAGSSVAFGTLRFAGKMTVRMEFLWPSGNRFKDLF